VTDGFQCDNPKCKKFVPNDVRKDELFEKQPYFKVHGVPDPKDGSDKHLRVASVCSPQCGAAWFLQLAREINAKKEQNAKFIAIGDPGGAPHG